MNELSEELRALVAGYEAGTVPLTDLNAAGLYIAPLSAPGPDPNRPLLGAWHEIAMKPEDRT